MKLPLISSHGEGLSEEVGSPILENWFASLPSTGKSNIVLHPTPGTDAGVTHTAPSSGTECQGGIAMQSLGFFNFGSGIFAHTETTGLTITTSGIATNGYTEMTANTTGSDEFGQIFITDGTNSHVVSEFYQSYWKLDGTATYNINSTAVAPTSGTALYDNVFTFETALGVELVRVGMTVHNITNDTWAFIASIDSSLQITLSAAIMSVGDAYEIAASYSGSGAVAVASTPPFTSPDTCTYLDGYFIANTKGIGRRQVFYISALNDATRWSALDFASAKKYSDKIIALRVIKGYLYIIGTASTEIWYNSGNADFPFQPVKNNYHRYGTVNASTAKVINDRLVMLTSTTEGGKEVIIFEGSNVSTVSTPEISTLLSSGIFNTVETFVYSLDGNHFYCITLDSEKYIAPDGNNNKITLCYNLSTGRWHRWSANSGSENYMSVSTLLAIRINDNSIRTSFLFGADDGKVYKLNQLAITALDQSTSKNRTLRTRVIHSDGVATVYSAVQLDIDNHTAFLKVASGSSGSFDAGVNVVSIVNPTANTDKVQNLTTGEAAVVITAVSANTVTAAGTWSEGDSVKFINGTTDAQMYPATGIGMRYRDDNGAWSTIKYRLVTGLKDRVIWRKLGKSHNREFEFTYSETPLTIIDAYAIVEDRVFEV